MPSLASVGASVPPPARFHYDLDDSTITVGRGFACVLTADGAAAADARVNATLAVAALGVEAEATPAPVDSFVGQPGDVASGGGLTCWGDAEARRAGALSPPLGAFTQVSAAEQHACAVRAGDGSVACWGGWLRSGGPRPEGSGYVQVTAGARVVCALRGDGRAACVGVSSLGQASPPPEGRFVQLSCGKGACCGLQVDGRLACWGGDYAGVTQPPSGADWVQVGGVAATRARRGGACQRPSLHSP